jgi:hypothetical protein
MSNSNFYEDLEFEKCCYNYIIKPFLNKKGYDTVFIHADDKKSDKYLINIIQKKKDIDCIVDDGKRNLNISFKAVRGIYTKIFFETIKNTNTNEKGWGYYSEADIVLYLMTNINNMSAFKDWLNMPNMKWKMYTFNIKDITSYLNVYSYEQAEGSTKDSDGKIMYYTLGRLIPISDFKHKFYES